MPETSAQAGPKSPRGLWAFIGFTALILLGWLAGIMITTAAHYRIAKLQNPGLYFWSSHIIGMLGNPLGMSQAALMAHTLGMLVTLICANWMRMGTAGEFLGLRPVQHRVLLRWLALTAGFEVAGDGLIYLCWGDAFIPRWYAHEWRTPFLRELSILDGLIWAPAFEELFFRGFLFRGLEASPLGTYGAIVASAIGFGAMHLEYSFFQITEIALLGLLLGAARAKTGSSLVPMAMHAFMNALIPFRAILFL